MQRQSPKPSCIGRFVTPQIASQTITVCPPHILSCVTLGLVAVIYMNADMVAENLRVFHYYTNAPGVPLMYMFVNSAMVGGHVRLKTASTCSIWNFVFRIYIRRISYDIL